VNQVRAWSVGKAVRMLQEKECLPAIRNDVHGMGNLLKRVSAASDGVPSTCKMMNGRFSVDI